MKHSQAIEREISKALRRVDALKRAKAALLSLEKLSSRWKRRRKRRGKKTAKGKTVEQAAMDGLKGKRKQKPAPEKTKLELARERAAAARKAATSPEGGE